VRTPTDRRLLPGVALGLVLALVVAACADPVDAPQQEGDAAQNPLGAEAPDPGREALVGEVDRLRDLLAAVSEHLSSAAAAESSGQLREETGAAVELLIGDPGGDMTPLFPVETGERGGGGGDDLLTNLLTVAREAGGNDGREVRELTRDLVAGDLGAWQRDADGMVAMVETVAAPGGALEETEQAVFELPGETTRALAWALLADATSDLERAREYAERGATHIDVAVSAIDELELNEG
jgi:hypothetical protein